MAQAAVAVSDALAAQARPASTSAPSQPPNRRVLTAGNAGPLGEAMLARLLGGDYRALLVATTKPIRSSSGILSCVDYAGLQEPAAWPAIDDLVLLVGGGHSFLRRDDAFPLLDEAAAIRLARAARTAGCKRLMVIAPMDAWLTMTLGHAALFDRLQLSLGTLGFDTLIVLRPSANATRGVTGNWLDRLAQGLLSTLAHYMTPARRQPLRAQLVADAAGAWLASLGPGNHHLDGESVQQWYAERRAAQRA